MPAVSLHAGRDEAHGQLVRQQAAQHHGDLRAEVRGELLGHALQQDAHVQALAVACGVKEGERRKGGNGRRSEQNLI